jgi:HPt (histidine-containing phosphotransfer) domain-containing protein
MSETTELAEKYKVMNLEDLLENFEDEEDILKEMIETFFLVMDEKMDSLYLAVNNNDLANIEFFAHNIKGAVSNFSAPPIVEVLKNMEMDARENKEGNAFKNYELAKKLIAQLNEILTKLKDELKD